MNDSIHSEKHIIHISLIQAIIAYLIFCGISLLSQIAIPIISIVVIVGIFLPIIWGKFQNNWVEMGFISRNIGSSILWAIIAGIIASIIAVLVLSKRSIPPDLILQLAIGIPIWVLLASPFQEFFFRGWMQPKMEKAIGLQCGLITTTAMFTLWHYFAPFVGKTAVPLDTPVGVLSTFGVGLVYGYAFQRTRNILTPWLAHAITGIVFIIVGAMNFRQPLM
jgi:membrane protease YdiL (CAAX protease family)